MMMIKNKKVLLICKESFSFPLYFIAEKLQMAGNDVGAFFVHPTESYFKKCLYNENTYFKFKDLLKEGKVYGLSDLCINFNEGSLNPPIDMNYLRNIEKEYTNFKNMNLQIISSQLLSRHFHNRGFFSYSSYENILYYLELSYKKVIEVLDEFKPELILDTEDGELLRTILNEVSFKRKIPYITIDYPRYDDYKIPTYCLGNRTDDQFKDEYISFLKRPKNHMRNEYAYIEELKQKSTIMSKEFDNTITSQYSPVSAISMFKSLLGKIIYFWNVNITNGNIKLITKNSILYANPVKHFLFYVTVEFKKQYLLRNNKYFESPSKNDDYVYMPLHLIPESTTFVKAPFYIDELNIIEQVSKSLPIGWKLYVKEHQSMLGERSFNFYNRIGKIPNVKLVQINYYKDPKPWIMKSKGVITITGTAAYESAMLGKMAIIFGDVPFKLIQGVHSVHSFEELPSIIASFEKIDNIKSCVAYLAAVRSLGKKINLKYLISEAEKILNGDEILSNEFDEEICQLLEFYEDAYIRYTSRIKN
jgi:hypothetical protein